MKKPDGYTVYDLVPVLDYIRENFDITEKEIGYFEQIALDEGGVAYFSTEDIPHCNIILRYILEEFGYERFIMKSGVPIKEVYLAT